MDHENEPCIVAISDGQLPAVELRDITAEVA